MPADLLLPVERDPDVDRQRPLLGEQTGGLEDEVRVALVVGRASRVEVAVAHLRLERVGLPEVERRRRLDIEVPVEEDGGRVGGPYRGADLPDRERVRVRLDQLRLAAGPTNELADPFTGPPHVVRVRRVGGDAGDAQPLGELREPGGIDPVRHRAESKGRRLAAACLGDVAELLRSASACSFFRHWFSIWRTRSRVTLNVRPTSSRVRGCWPSRP